MSWFRLTKSTRANVARLADRLVDHILTHLWPEPPAPLQGQPPVPALPMGMRGDYSPAADQYQPSIAPPMEQALCAWAMIRYAQCEDVDRTRAGKGSSIGAHGPA